MHEKGQVTAVRVGLDPQLLLQFSDQPGDGVLSAIEVTGREAELPVAVAGTRPPDQQQSLSVAKDSIYSNGSSERLEGRRESLSVR